MAESNATQVILTDDGIKIINAQNTADNVAGGVANLNDPNLMSVIEKQTQATQYAGLTSQYNVILKRAKDASISTTALTTAYTNLNTFMTAILTNTTKASDVNRDTYKAFTDAYNTALSKVQTALSNSFNTDIDNMQSSVSVASQAASSAIIVASQATVTGNSASQVASQAVVVASQAKSAGDNATSVANNASQAASNAVIVGSTAAVNANKAISAANQAKSAGDNATSVANNVSQATSDAILVGSQALVAGNAASDAYDKLKISNRNLALLSAPGYVDKHSNVDILLDNDALTLSDPVWASFDWKVTQAGRWRINQVQTNSNEIWSDIFVENNASTDIVSTSDRLSGHYSGLISWTPIQSGTTQVRLHVNQTTNVGTLTINNFVLSNSSKEVMWTPAETVLSNAVIGTAQIKNAAITSAKIGSLAVGTAQIASAAVGTAQIGDGAITNAKIGNLAVGTAQIANGAITNAQIGSLAVGTANIKDAAISSAKIANLAVGTAQIGNGAITTAKIGNLAVGTAQIANAAITDAQVGNVSANKLTAGTIDFNTITGKNINASNITTGTLSTDRLNVDKLSAVSANLGNVTTGSLKGVYIVAKSFSTPNGSFTTDENGSVVASNLTIRGVTNLVYNAALLGGSGSSIPGWNIWNNGTFWAGNTHDGVSSIGYNASTGANVWTNFAQTKLHPLNGATGQPYSASVWFKEYGSDTSLSYQFTLAFFDSNGNRIEGAYGKNGWNGIGSGQDWRYITVENVTPPSNAVYVGLQYWAYNGHGNACFSSPMLTQTAQSTGYQPDTGNVVSAGEIDGSVINGSTINGTTFHGGDVINNGNNTAGYYPMTITPGGAYKSTYFDGAVGLQSSVESGAISYKYRSMIGSGQYLAYDSVINGQGFQSQSGYTSAKDTTFSNPETITGYVNVTPATGIYLYGPTQQINFAGRSDNIGSDGITMDAYGNIYAQSNSTWWRIGDVNGNQIINFGIDKAGSNDIQFNRELDIGNIGINTAHSIISQDGKGLYINSGRGGRADLNVANLNYTGSVSKSLLSEKKDVKKVDTAYWAQLVNSIDLATYQYKDDDNTSNLRLSGIVDDVNDTKQWQLPDVFVARDEDGKLAGIENTVLQNAMLATIQEQQNEIDKLNGHLLELEAKLNG